MKLKKYQKIAIAVPSITIVVVGLFTIKSMMGPTKPNDSIMLSILFTALVSISISLANFPIFERMKLQFPIRIDIFKRVTIGFLISSLTATTIITAWILIFYAIFQEEGFKEGVDETGVWVVIFDNILIAVVINFIIGSLVTLRHSIIGWKNSIIEAEQYKRQSIESQYSALINQINPHFLFNSMNALSSLIPQSPEKAIEFVNRFSKIYRYVLDVKDKIVCQIKDELDFLDSYCYLQKIRFGDNLMIEKHIDASCLNYYLPPLSLQLLVENAIKHNEISKTNPLNIKIVSNSEFIAISNNVKLKLAKQDSPGIGLKNLKERYNHLTDQKPEFLIKNNEYIAKVPLIKEE